MRKVFCVFYASLQLQQNRSDRDFHPILFKYNFIIIDYSIIFGHINQILSERSTKGHDALPSISFKDKLRLNGYG